jgi:hypothetical protein
VPDRVGKDIVVAGKPVEFCPGLGVKAAEAFFGNRRRHAVGFGKHDVEANGNGAHPRDVRNQIGEHRARPGPLADFFLALVIQVDNDDRPRRLLARAQDLKEIENAQPRFLQRLRVGYAQRHQRKQEQRAHRPRQTELPRPASD